MTNLRVVSSRPDRTSTFVRLRNSHKAEDEIENIELAIGEMTLQLGKLKHFAGDREARVELRKAARLAILSCDEIEAL